MALLKTKGTMPLLVVATVIMAFAVSRCFGKGGGTACAGTLTIILF